MAVLFHPSVKTRGEIAFAKFLTERAIDFDYEPAIAGCTKRPDFRIDWRGVHCFFEVKDRENVDDAALFPDIREIGNDLSMPEVQAPYEWIRGKIGKARTKFGGVKGSPCALVLFPATGFASDLEEPDFVLGSMYGDAAMDVDHDVIVFVDNGRMFKPGTRIPRNRTVSAVISLRMLDLGYARRRLIRRGEMVVSEQESLHVLGFHWSDTPRMGVIVWENVYATTPLPRDLFVGPFDERWSGDVNTIRCIHRGTAVAECHRAFA